MTGKPSKCIQWLLGVLAVFWLPVALAEVEVQALFTNAAMLKIDGSSKMLKSGQSYKGVTLVSADSQKAVVEIAGKRQQLKVSGRITSNYEQPATREVSIPRDSNNQYLVRATINGRAMTVLVDTGANVVAMNSGHANALGINYRSGVASTLESASGTVSSWVVKLDSVDVGGIRVNNVSASVVDGSFPTTILLGMTYLEHVNMQEKNGVLLLSRDY